jgi:hypothetical protein
VKHYSLGSINPLILLGIRESCLISGRGLLLYQFTSRAVQKTLIIIMGYQCYQLHTNPQILSVDVDEITGDHHGGFIVTDKHLMTFFFCPFIRYWN